MALGFTSCQTANFNNFNKKKFTNLKPIEATYPEQDSEVSVQASALTENNSELNKNFKDDLDRLTENDPKIIAIQKAIKSKTPIIIKDGDLIYEVKKPFYDGIARSLIGDLVEIDEPLDEDYLELTVKGVKESRFGLTEISVNDISFYQRVNATQKEVEEDEQEIEPGNGEKEQIEREPIKQQEAQALNLNAEEESKQFYFKSKHATNARGTFTVGAILAFVVVASLGMVALLSLIPFLAVAAAAIVPALILMIVSYKQSRKYQKECKKASKKEYKQGRRTRKAALFFIILGSIVMGIGLLAGGLWLLFDYLF